MPLSTGDIQNRLLRLYQRESPTAKIVDFSRITDGWENEVYAFAIESETATERMILRIYPGQRASQKAEKEFHVMKQLHAMGMPVPKVLRMGIEASPFGQPFVIMEKINGKALGEVFRQSSDARRQALITLFCQQFVALHAVDWRPFVPYTSLDETGDAWAWVTHQLSKLRKRMDDFGKHEFDPILDWLEARRLEVPCKQLSLIHSDYHPNNVLLTDNGEAFIIDWGGADIADLRIDLGWTLLLVGTHGSPEVRDVIRREYERITGHPIEQIEYFEVMAILRRLFDISVSLSSGAAQMGMRPGAEALMKQNAEPIKNVYERLGELTGIATPEIAHFIATLSD